MNSQPQLEEWLRLMGIGKTSNRSQGSLKIDKRRYL